MPATHPSAHPIVEQMSPSDEQRPPIDARGRDVVVVAGAGAGKTRTLVARYLALLAEGFPLRSIVAITFTKKAAREMRNRIREQMRRYLDRVDLPAAERDQWQQLYGALDAARIDTIHGLCTEILRSHPAEAAIDPRFDVLDEGQSGILRGQAIDEALSWAANDPQVVQLFEWLGEADLRDTLAQLLARPLDVQAAFSYLPDDLIAYWQNVLRDRQTEVLNALRANADWQLAVITLRENVSPAASDKMEEMRRLALAAIDGAVGQWAECIASLAQLNAVNLKGGSVKSWPHGKDQLEAVRNALRALRGLWRAQAELLTAEWNAFDEILAQSLPLLRRVFVFVIDRYAAFKRERNALDFDDLESGALELLQRHESARTRWQGEVRALLVDEFQDTNGRQRDLISLLNGDERKLFIVGDAKQSIYRFRGADVTVFRAERDRIDQAGGQLFSLYTSYRAHRDLVHSLNGLFAPIFGSEADATRPWIEPFAELLPDRDAARSGFVPPYIELHLTVGSKSGGALTRAAEALAVRLASLVDSGAARYDEMAILCRASTSFAAYEDALERAGIPFLTVAGRGFYDRPEIRDLLNALQALADPTDDLALIGLLRSPALALSDLSAYQLSFERRRLAATAPLWIALQVIDTSLLGVDAARAIRAVQLITDLQARIGRASVADVLKAFLDASDYRAALMNSGQVRSARNVSKLLAVAQVSGIVSINEFLEYIANLRDSGAREGEARSTTEGAVSIMSVHAAKGLEFPVVVLGDITYDPPRRNRLLLDPELGPLMPLQDQESIASLYQLGQQRAGDQELAESDRLLYVAATRAQELLLMSGCVSLKQDHTFGSLGGWLGRLADQNALSVTDEPVAYAEDGVGIRQIDLSTSSAACVCFIYEPNVPKLIDRWPAAVSIDQAMPLPPPLLGPTTALAAAPDRRDPERAQHVWRVVPAVDRPRAPAWVVGALTHEALAAWRFPEDSFDRWAEARARGYGLTDHRQLTDAVRRSRKLLQRFQNDPLYHEMDVAEQRLHEIPYSVSIDNRSENGVLDALYLHDSVWTIVEFKTDVVADEYGLDRLFDEQDYRAQVRRYSTAVEHVLGSRLATKLCLLDYADTVRVVSDL